MTRLSLSASVLLAFLVAAPVAAQTDTLRWARGMVTAVAPTAFTLQLRDRSMAIARDAASPPLTTGAIVEVHYLETKNARTAVEIFTDSADLSISKKPGRSYRGVTGGTGRSSLKLNLGKKNKNVDLDSKTRLIDADGRVLATGKNDVKPLLANGLSVIVKFQEDDTSMIAGDVMIPGESDRALEIRQLKKTM